MPRPLEPSTSAITEDKHCFQPPEMSAPLPPCKALLRPSTGNAYTPKPRENLDRGTRKFAKMGSCPQEHVLTCLASLTESLVRRERSWGSRWAAGAISTTFWCRRWMEQSRSYKCRMFPYWSPEHSQHWIQPSLEPECLLLRPLAPWALLSQWLLL